MAIGILRPVFRYCAAIAGALLLAFLLADMVLPDAASMGLEGALIFALFMLIGGLVGWLAAEMLVQKSFRVFHMGRKWFGFGALWLLLSALLLCGELDLTGYENACRNRTRSSPSAWTSPGLHGAGRAGEHRGGPRAARERHRGRTPTRAPPGPARASATALPPPRPRTRRQTTTRRTSGSATSSQTAGGCRDAIISASAKRRGAARDGPQLSGGHPLPEAAGHRASASTVSYASVSWVNAQGEPESLELSGAEAAELYWNCILPDMQDGEHRPRLVRRGGRREFRGIRLPREHGACKRRRGGRGLRLFLHHATPPLRADQRLASGRGVLLKTPEELGNDWLIS